MKYAVGVLGLAGVVAVVEAWGIDRRVAVFGCIVVLGMMFVLRDFAEPGRHGARSRRSGTLGWFAIVLFMVSASLIASSFFVHWPLDFRPREERIPELRPVPVPVPEPVPLPDLSIRRESGWTQGGGADAFCGQRELEIQREHPGRTVIRVNAGERHRSTWDLPNFKRDYYNYSCDFRVTGGFAPANR